MLHLNHFTRDSQCKLTHTLWAAPIMNLIIITGRSRMFNLSTRYVFTNRRRARGNRCSFEDRPPQTAPRCDRYRWRKRANTCNVQEHPSYTEWQVVIREVGNTAPALWNAHGARKNELKAHRLTGLQAYSPQVNRSTDGSLLIRQMGEDILQFVSHRGDNPLVGVVVVQRTNLKWHSLLLLETYSSHD